MPQVNGFTQAAARRYWAPIDRTDIQWLLHPYVWHASSRSPIAVLASTMDAFGFHESKERKMRWPLTIASVVVSLLTASIAAFMIVKDRQEAIAQASERTSSISRMIIAHGDASASIAEQIVSVALPLVAQWDLRDTATGKDLHDRLRLLVGNNSDVAAAAVLDGKGNLLVTSRDFPVEPMNLSDRPFFGLHAAGSTGSLITGDEAAGPVSGRKRFTFSQSDLNSNGCAESHRGRCDLYERNGYSLRRSSQLAGIPRWPLCRRGRYTGAGTDGVTGLQGIRCSISKGTQTPGQAAQSSAPRSPKPESRPGIALRTTLRCTVRPRRA